MAYETTRVQIQLQSIENGTNWYPQTDVAFVLGLEDWLKDKKYITDSVLSDYVTSNDLDEILDDYVSSESLDETLSNYVLSTTLTTELNKKVDNTKLESYYTKSESDEKFLTEQSLDEYATKEEVEQVKKDILGDDLEETFNTLKEVQEWADEHGTEYAELVTEVGKKANTIDVYSKEEADKIFLKEHQSLDDYYTKSEVDDLIKGVDVSNQLKDYALKSYVDEAIANLRKEIGVKATTVIE